MHENKVALVTGANKGIGHAIASALAARGLTVLVGARDAARGEAAAQRIAGDARACPLDVTRADSIAAAVSRIQREFGRLDVLVNNAGIATFGTASTTRQRTVDEAAKQPVRLALLGDDGPTGTFSNDAGTIPW
jgi:NAD(P)-dependent dehydrogenase (short-subunit alcohol dehydrogenase family)